MKKSKKPYIIVGVLLAYMVVMAVANRETLTVYHDYASFFGAIVAELVVLSFLFYFLKKRERLKAERKQDLEQAERERAERDRLKREGENAEE